MRNLKKNIEDYLDLLAENALKLTKFGYYDINFNVNFTKLSLADSILSKLSEGVNPIIGEIKPSSPSLGFKKNVDVKKIAKLMVKGGCAGISVLVEPNYFKGHLMNIVRVKDNLRIPTLFKDIVVSPKQIEAASKLGADAILLINQVFLRGYYPGTLEDALDLAFKFNLEPLVEVHTLSELKSILNLNVNLIGINSRNFKTLKTSLEKTARILRRIKRTEKIIVCESGIKNADDIRKLKKSGGKAFLVGSSIMLSENVEKFVRELVYAC